MLPNDIPIVGQTVHIVVSCGLRGEGMTCRAAIITEIVPEPNPNACVSLVEFGGHALSFSQNVPNRPLGGIVGTWHLDWRR